MLSRDVCRYAETQDRVYVFNITKMLGKGRYEADCVISTPRIDVLN